MKALDQSYQIQLDQITKELQASEDLSKYLEEEEEEYYNSLKTTYEPQIQAIYETIARDNPLQLVSFERALLADELEGVFLPRILGFSALRGEVNENYKYVRPQSHFRAILFSICNSSNFDILKKRIGQTIQVGFALSSDIWVTNFLNEFSNKKIRQFLLAQKLPEFRNLAGRRGLLFRYKNQFKNENFYTCDFPTTGPELTILSSSIKNFLLYRVKHNLDNSSVRPSVIELLENESFHGSIEHANILQIFTNFFNHEGPQVDKVKSILKTSRAHSEFASRWIEYHTELQSKDATNSESDLRTAALLDMSIEDDLTPLYQLLEVIHTNGFMHETSVEAVRNFYGKYEGMSSNNQVVRGTIMQYIRGILNNITVDNYTEYFELSKIFPVYIGIFENQHFNQDIKVNCTAYVKLLKKRYTDKRGKDYQDIKKFVVASFVDLKFMTEKQLVEFFKTKRKKKVEA